MMNYSDLETARIDARREMQRLDDIANDSRRLLESLQELADAAGVRPGWADAEPRGIDAHYARVVAALSGEAMTPMAIQIAVHEAIAADEDRAV